MEGSKKSDININLTTLLTNGDVLDRVMEFMSESDYASEK